MKNFAQNQNCQARNKNRFNKQRGNLLIDMSIATGLAAIIALIGWALVPDLLASYNASKITTELKTAIPKIQAGYNNRTSFAILTTEEVAKMRWFSDGFLEKNGNIPNGSIKTKWGDITFAPASGNNQAVGTLDNIPSRECIKIVEDFGQAIYTSATVNSTSIKTATTALATTTASDQCNSSETNTLTFNFRR
nr:type 4 pilus major pilin [uncultured Comamonas sp.]